MSGCSRWIFLVIQFRAAFEGPYAALGTGAFSWAAMEPAIVPSVMNLGVVLDALRSGSTAWNKRAIPTAFTR